MCATTSSLLNPQHQSVLYISSQAVDYLSRLHILFTECRQRASTYRTNTRVMCKHPAHFRGRLLSKHWVCVCVFMQAILCMMNVWMLHASSLEKLLLLLLLHRKTTTMHHDAVGENHPRLVVSVFCMFDTVHYELCALWVPVNHFKN